MLTVVKFFLKEIERFLLQKNVFFNGNNFMSRLTILKRLTPQD
jgi:hypothetical protein